MSEGKGRERGGTEKYERASMRVKMLTLHVQGEEADQNQDEGR